MYEIRMDVEGRLIHDKLVGFWDLATAERFLRDFNAAIDKVAAAGPELENIGRLPRDGRSDARGCRAPFQDCGLCGSERPRQGSGLHARHSKKLANQAHGGIRQVSNIRFGS